MTPVLAAEQISVALGGRAVLEGVSLTVEPGMFVGIVGPNGGGKSTLLRALLGLVPIEQGEVRLFGERLTPRNAARLRRRVGFLPQLRGHGVEVPLGVREYVAFSLRRGWGPPCGLGKRVQAQVLEALEAVGMAGLLTRDVRRLSGGQWQRVRIARALAGWPRLVLLDEPSAALDAEGKARLFEALRRYCDEGGAVLMVEHDIAAISPFVDAIACLNRRIHQHVRRGERISEDTWRALYGAMQPIAHDHRCLGCGS